MYGANQNATANTTVNWNSRTKLHLKNLKMLRSIENAVSIVAIVIARC